MNTITRNDPLSGRLCARKVIIWTKNAVLLRILAYLAAFLLAGGVYIKQLPIPTALLYALIVLLFSLLGETTYQLLRYYAYTDKPLNELEKKYSPKSGQKIEEIPPTLDEAMRKWQKMKENS